MRKNIFYVLVFLAFVSCKNEQMSLRFVSEYVIKDSLNIKRSVFGGVSGIDFYNNEYYMVVDDAKTPRIYKSEISIAKDTITNIIIKDVIFLNDTSKTFYKENVLDLESIFIQENGNINLVSEGSISQGKNPLVFSVDLTNNTVQEYKMPSYFKATSEAKPKHNGVFEGSCKSFDKKGFWVAMEAPLEVDGEEPTFHKTQSPVRITYFDSTLRGATKQYVYELEKIDKPAKGDVNLNGVTAILEYKKDVFFIVERAYQSGYGSYGNVVRIFKASVEEKSTNTLEIESLKEEKYIPLKKELLFDFTNVQHQLTDRIIDNIEGITFGPVLSNGNQSIILVSDDNFQVYGKQLNQFILLEITNK